MGENMAVGKSHLSLSLTHTHLSLSLSLPTSVLSSVKLSNTGSMLKVLGVYDWSGNNPIFPELWVAPKFLPFHPGTTRILFVMDVH